MIRKVFNIDFREQKKINEMMEIISRHEEFETRKGSSFESNLIKYLINTYKAFNVDDYIKSLPEKNKNDKFLKIFLKKSPDYFKKYRMKKRGLK